MGRIKNKFRYTPAVSDGNRLILGSVIRDTVFGLTGGKNLKEGRPAVAQPVQNRLVQIGRIGDRNLGDKGRSVAAEKSFGN